MKPKNPAPADPAIRILKIATCPSVSGKSKLTYHIACRPDSEVFFRINDNDGGGFHSDEWISATAMNKHLRGATFVRAGALHPLFKGRSVNTAGFLLAVLLAEGLVVKSKQKPRAYERTPGAEFVAEVKALMESGVSLSPDVPAGPPAKKPGKGVKPVAKAAPAVAPVPPIKTATASARKQANRQPKGASSKAA